MASEIVEVVGTQVMAGLVAMILYGIVAAQAYMYWWNYPNDPKINKMTVLVVWLLETAHTAFLFHVMYTFTVTDFGNTALFDVVFWSYLATTSAATLIAACVQSFFLRRVWVVSKGNIFMTAIPGFLLLCRVVLGYVALYSMFLYPNFAAYRAAKAPGGITTTGLVLAATVDGMVAALLVYNLQRLRTGARSTNHMIKLLQVYVVNTGLLTMMVSISILLTFFLLPTSRLYVGLVQIQSKLYANSLLGTLNARNFVNKREGNTAGAELISMEFAQRPSTKISESTPGSTTKITDNASFMDQPSTTAPTSSLYTDEDIGAKKVHTLI